MATPEILAIPRTGKTFTPEDLAAERNLVQKAKNGDQKALATIFINGYPRVLHYMLVRTSNAVEAEDLASEVFVRVIESIPRYEDQGMPFSAWLFTIAHNQVVNRYRRDGKIRFEPLSIYYDGKQVERLIPDPIDIEGQVEAKQVLEKVRRAVQQLSESQRRIITLRFIEDNLSLAETAQAVGKTENNVRVTSHKAISRLKEILSGQYQQKFEAKERIKQKQQQQRLTSKQDRQLRTEQRSVRREQSAKDILHILINAGNAVSSAQISERLKISIWEVRMRIKQLRDKQAIPIKARLGRRNGGGGGGYYLEDGDKKRLPLTNYCKNLN